jgi:hypothetical protein
MKTIVQNVLDRFGLQKPEVCIISVKTIRLLNFSVARGYPRDPTQLGAHIGRPELLELIRRFIYDQQYPDADISGQNVDLDKCPEFLGHVYVYHSAVATFYAPSDLAGRYGMHKEQIHATPLWHGAKSPRYDCIFVESNRDEEGFQGLYTARVFLLFAFTYNSIFYPCALIHWFSTVGHKPCENTGMWMVEPEFHDDGRPFTTIIHLDCILSSAHLIGSYGRDFLPYYFSFSDSFDALKAFFVNKYADHHSNEIAF